ncbi:hypothetical protein BT93_L5815 [Corymbia citriodora subsp. variegata]|uniref:Uncharacterized protein n=1 Tax=Corymbia citriodora subsp. variegata TaxID=360336 RepID=A0A8T0CEX2_CORYI|nr:hypothetical protein BT93_L5815 [Corymbia citriodora subsp. variegata]
MSYIPSLTLPSSIFNSPALSILLPVTLGLGTGFLSQPGKNTPKSPSDTTNPDRQTFRDSTQKKYASLRQPPLRPPPWVFAPAWTSLYVLMGYASHRAWTTGISSLNPSVVQATEVGATLYTVQLVLNQLFMPLFFGLGRPVEALIDVGALLGVVGWLTKIWSEVDRRAAWCMVPYLGWLGFATYLTAGTGYLNEWSFKEDIKKE